MRWPEQIAVNVLSSLLDVGQVFFRIAEQTPVMIVGMVASAMTTRQNILIDIGVAHDIFSDTEESSFDAVPVKDVQYPRSNLRYWSVIEGQVNYFFVRAFAP